MQLSELNISRDHLHKLLSAASGDAALLYLYIAAGNPPEEGERALGLGGTRYGCAAATLRQLGLWPEKRTPLYFPVNAPAIRSGMSPWRWTKTAILRRCTGRFSG